MSNLNQHEHEVIILNAVCSLIDEMNNRAMFKLYDSSIIFHTAAHTKLFNILLVDFLSKIHGSKLLSNLEKPDNISNVRNNSYLYYLLNICASPSLGGDISEFESACNIFAEWLDDFFMLEKVWFPSIDLQIDIKVKRFDALKHTGNIAKHNFTRLEHTVSKVREILIENECNPTPTLEECYLVLPEFQDWFHTHAFVALSSAISEQLNNIRWGIHHYLTDEYRRAYRPEYHAALHFQSYTFDVPKEISHPFARTSYWELMNSARREPILPKYQFAASMHQLLSSNQT